MDGVERTALATVPFLYKHLRHHVTHVVPLPDELSLLKEYVVYIKLLYIVQSRTRYTICKGRLIFYLRNRTHLTWVKRFNLLNEDYIDQSLVLKIYITKMTFILCERNLDTL